MATIDKTSPLAPAGGFPAIAAIDGLRFATIAAGVRYQGRDDVMLACLDAGTAIAGVFTRSATRAAPVLDCQAKLGTIADPGDGFAILVNSGNANAFTGHLGTQAVDAITAATAHSLNIPQSHVYTSSTGVIGEPLAAEKIAGALDGLRASLSATGIEAAARAIMTTDTFPKGASIEAVIDGAPIKIAGIAKGSGMIAPDMATMLVYIFTDARITQPVLQKIVAQINARTFNCITVDSDTSTSDTLLVAATGKAEMAEIRAADSDAARLFSGALEQVMRDLAHQVVRDGEGASKFVEIAVNDAASDAQAHKIAMSIANSPLVKTAIAGEDPNWGRIVMAIGKSGARADRDRLAIYFGDILVAKDGWVSPDYKETDAAAYMKQQDLVITVDIGLGTGSATVWTCDLTRGYIEINADYRS